MKKLTHIKKYSLQPVVYTATTSMSGKLSVFLTLKRFQLPLAGEQPLLYAYFLVLFAYNYSFPEQVFVEPTRLLN